MATTPNSLLWDDLRKKARKLESGVESQLAAYARLGTHAPGQSEADSHANDIDVSLERLGSVNEKMAECVRRNSSDLLSHTLARHADILHEFKQEYRRMKATISANLQHAQLLDYSGRRNGSRTSAGSSIDKEMAAQQALLRERGLLHAATSRADEVIAQAQAQALALQQQGSLFTEVGGKVQSMAQRFPVVNQLLTAIRRKKSRDTIILSVVVAVCCIFILLYWLSK